MTRGEIWWADFGLPFGSEPGFERPVLVVQANSFNQSEINTTLVVPFTTNTALAEAPGNVLAKRRETRLSKDSAIVVSQPTALDKRRLLRHHGHLPAELARRVEEGLRLVLDLRRGM